MKANFSANIRKEGENFIVEYFNGPKQVIFRYETKDYQLAQTIQSRSMWLFYKWQGVRETDNPVNSWSTFSLVAEACYFPTRCGGHAIIYTVIEYANL